jgi:hypothetical protein
MTMTKSQKAKRVQRAAADVLERYHAGAQFHPETIDWARDVALSVKRYRHPSPLQDKVLSAFAIVMPAGLKKQDVLRLTGVKPSLLDQTLTHMVKNGRLFKIHIPQRTRYFATAEARDLAEPLVRAEEERFALEHKRGGRLKNPAPKVPKVPKMTKPSSPKLVPVQRERNLPQRIFKPKDVRAPSTGSVFIPPHVQVQVCPSFEDNRFKAQGTGEGGFLDEWRRLRGEGS